MKGLQPLFLGIFGIFAFSWLGLTVIPNLQIGSLNPQTDEDGGDIYPQPLSGMVHRGAEVYAANGCVYCHSQQVRPEYGGADLDRKWGVRRSAPRDYIFEPIVFLGKMRLGPDLANVGHRVTEAEKGAATATPAPGGSPAAAGATAAASPAASAAPAGGPSSGASPAAVAAAASPSPSLSPVPAAGTQSAASAPSLVANAKGLTSEGQPLPYSAAWFHRHLYDPRSLTPDSNMPAYRFLYTKRRISGETSSDALNFVGDEDETFKTGWEIVPSYDAKCLVAYLMSRDQSHP
ncbi:MAG: cbb3-type cytochrome c oxidase subunit II, partial [Chthoniobacterales bacterium]